jgi:hypothetical protein
MMNLTPTASEMPSEMPSGELSEPPSEQLLETVFVSSSHEQGTNLFDKSPRIEYLQSEVDPKQNQRSDRDR